MATKSQFEKAVAKCSATQDLEMLDSGTLQVDAPKGFVFSSNGCHTLVVQFANNGGQSWKAAAYADIIESLNYGIELCELDDCDMCEGA